MVRSKQSAQSRDEPAMPVPEKLWRVVDVAKFLNIGREQVYSLIRERKLPYIRLGNGYRFHPEAVARWAEKQVEVL